MTVKGSCIIINSCPLSPLPWEEQWVSLPDRGGFGGILQDKCKYVKLNILFYLHEMTSERTSCTYFFG